MLPRGSVGIWLLRVHTRNSVDPGRYSQRSTAFPRSDRNVNVGSENEKLGAPPPSVSASRVIVAGSRAGFAAGVTTSVPKSLPKTKRRVERGAAQTLYRAKSPETTSGCTNSSSVVVGENVTFKRVSIASEI